jgi:uncharacterized protein
MNKKAVIAAPPQASGQEVDLFRFVADGASAQGECAVAELPRLAAETLNLDAHVVWSAQGGRRAMPHQLDSDGGAILRDFLLLKAQTTLIRRCDRCGEPVPLPLAVDTRLEVFRTETEADDAPLEDESTDPIVGSKKFSLLQQVEEELLLGIPPFAAHSSCNIAQDSTSAAKPNPFSKLAGLQTAQKSKK